jgi:hypothetical protein
MIQRMSGNATRMVRTAAGFLLVVAGASCRSRPESAGGPYGDIVAQAVPAVEQAVGLKFKTPPRIEVRTKEQVRDYVLKQLADTATMRQIAGQSEAYKLLGMIPDTLDLPKLMTRLLEEQIVGFYDPETKVLYIVKGSPRESAQLIVTHELVHALQDQYVNLDSIQKLTSDNDRQSAEQAVFEGEAVYEQIHAMLGPGNIAVAMPGGWDRVRQTIRNNQAAMPVYASAPMVIQETLVFPYLSGAEFVRNFRAREPGRVPFRDLPVSTSQILHQNEFFDKRVAPTPVSFAAVSAVHPTYENDLGEFETRLYLYQHLNDVDVAARGATGWNGDRYVTWNTARGPAIAWATVWLTPDRAADFYELMQRVATAREPAKSGRTEKITTGEIDGRPVVLLVDTPAGMAPPVSLSDVRLGKQP